jgi:hypothetical protein
MVLHGFSQERPTERSTTSQEHHVSWQDHFCRDSAPAVTSPMKAITAIGSIIIYADHETSDFLKETFDPRHPQLIG